LKLIGTHRFLAYADDVNILGGGIRTMKKKAEDLIVDNKKTAKEN
jgi:hypothetical protein